MTQTPRRLIGTNAERAAAFDLLVLSTRLAPADEAGALSTLAGQTSNLVLRGLADYHGVSGFLYEELRSQPDAWPDLIDELRRSYASAVRNHLRAIYDLRQLQPVLDADDIPWAIVKGPALVESLYSEAPGRRSYFDVDLLIEPARFVDAIRALEGIGAKLLDRNWKLLRHEQRGDVHLLLSSGMPIDLHWDVIRAHRGPMRVPIGELLFRARRFDIGGIKVPVLEGTDGFLHLALDAAMAGGDRLVALKDIGEAAAAWQPDWAEVVSRARKWRVGAPVGLMLARAQDILGAPIPLGVIRALGSPRMQAASSVVERVSPWRFGLGRELSATRLFAAGIGQGPLGFPLWLAARTVHGLNPARSKRDSPFTRRGDTSDREAFFAHIVRSGR